MTQEAEQAPEETQKKEPKKKVVQLTMEELEEFAMARTKRLIKELDLTRVDEKHAMFPGVEDGDNPELAKKERVGKFFQAAILGNQVTPELQKALSEGTATAGGYLVPDDFRAEVIMRINDLAQLWPRVFHLATVRDALEVPNLGTDVELSWDEAENEAFDESDPAVGHTTFSIHRMNAITHQSRELFADSPVNVVTFLTELFADAISRERDKVINIGNGTDRPQGIYSATITQSVDVSGTLAFDDLVDIETQLKVQYRQNAHWVMNRTNIGRIRKLTDDNGQPIFNRDITKTASGTLLGYPILECGDMPSSHIYLGDPKKYWWVDREQMGFESTTTGGDAFKKHQVSLKVWERVDGKIVLVEAWAMADNITG